MTSHDRFLELAAIAIDFRLAPAELSRLEAHLAGCGACRNEAAAFHADARAIAALPPARLSERRADALLATTLHPSVVRHPLRLLAVAALIGLLLVGTALAGSELLRRAQQDSPLVVVPNPPASLDPNASPAAPAWAAVPVPVHEADGRWDILVRGVAIGSDGMVAFGGYHCRDDETDCRLTMLWSADGGSWQVVPAQDSLWTEMYNTTSGPTLGIIDVVYGPAGWVAVGRVADPAAEGRPIDFHVATWTSADGRLWTRSADESPFEGVDPQAIAAGATNYAIVGTDYSASTDLATGTAWAAALASSDGRTWTRTGLDQQLDTGGFCDTLEWPAYGGMQAVAAVDGGGYVAVGAVETGDLAPDVTCSFTSAAWTSPDGLAWQRVASFPEVDGGSSYVATDGTHLVAMLGATVATSVDGRTWDTRPAPDGLRDPTIAFDGADIVLADPTGIGRLGTTLWRSSPGGSDWTEEPLPGIPLGTVQIAAIDVRDHVAAIVGWAEQFDEGEPPSYSLVRGARSSSLSPAPSPVPPADVAQLRCNGDGSSTLLTPSVRAQADGVHIITTNDTGNERALHVDGIGGDNAGPGSTETVWPIEPGTIRIACYDSSTGPAPDTAYVSLEVIDPDGSFVPTALDCAEATVGTDLYPVGAPGWAGDPVELTRVLLAKGHPTDVAQAAGYAANDTRQVRVLDGGRAVARLSWAKAANGGWLLDGVTTCSGTELALDYEALAGQVPSPSPAATVPLGADLVWERTPDQAALADAGMSAIAVGPDRYVAVGCSTAVDLNDSDCSGAAWVSTDGRGWTRGTVAAADHLNLGGVIAAPIGYLAWAYDTGAAFWFSPDGRQWQRAATIPSFSYDFVGNVVWFGGRFVALSTGNEPADAAPHIWVSGDGLAWSDQTDAIGCDSGQQPYEASGTPGSNVVVLGDELVTVGESYQPADENEYRGAEDYRRVVSRSSDGICWTVTTGASGGWTFDVTATASGLVGVGIEHDPPGSSAESPRPPIAAWVSDDPTSWASATFVDAAPRGELSFVAAGDRGILALGSTESGYSQWRSVDGATWSGSKGSLKEISDLAAIPDGFIAVGRETLASGKVRAVVWIAR